MAQPVVTQQESPAARPATSSQERRAAATQQPMNMRRASDDEILEINPPARVAIPRKYRRSKTKAKRRSK